MNPNQTQIKTIIVDDEVAFINTMRHMIQKYPQFDIIGTARGVQEAKVLIESVQPTLIFLDVEMEDGTGFDLLKLIDSNKYKIIFVTAFDHYAIEAFKFSAIDYLLKPIVSQDLADALDKVQSSINKDIISISYSVLINNLQNNKKEKKKIVLKEFDTHHVIEIDDILWCQADGSYTKFFLTSDKSILVSRILKEFEDLLTTHGFFRAHRSHLVNLNKIKTFEKSEGSILYLEGGYSIPVSVRKKEKLAIVLSQL